MGNPDESGRYRRWRPWWLVPAFLRIQATRQQGDHQDLACGPPGRILLTPGLRRVASDRIPRISHPGLRRWLELALPRKTIRIAALKRVSIVARPPRRKSMSRRPVPSRRGGRDCGNAKPPRATSKIRWWCISKSEKSGFWMMIWEEALVTVSPMVSMWKRLYKPGRGPAGGGCAHLKGFTTLTPP